MDRARAGPPRRPAGEAHFLAGETGVIELEAFAGHVSDGQVPHTTNAMGHHTLGHQRLAFRRLRLEQLAHGHQVLRFLRAKNGPLLSGGALRSNDGLRRHRGEQGGDRLELGRPDGLLDDASQVHRGGALGREEQGRGSCCHVIIKQHRLDRFLPHRKGQLRVLALRRHRIHDHGQGSRHRGGRGSYRLWLQLPSKRRRPGPPALARHAVVVPDVAAVGIEDLYPLAHRLGFDVSDPAAEPGVAASEGASIQPLKLQTRLVLPQPGSPHLLVLLLCLTSELLLGEAPIDSVQALPLVPQFLQRHFRTWDHWRRIGRDPLPFAVESQLPVRRLARSDCSSLWVYGVAQWPARILHSAACSGFSLGDSDSDSASCARLVDLHGDLGHRCQRRRALPPSAASLMPWLRDRRLAIASGSLILQVGTAADALKQPRRLQLQRLEVLRAQL
eukprot:scaffold7052_cov254-Pinguiococcus_pyrenoidosus.AAC.66